MSHFYSTAGEPRHFVPNASKPGTMRPSTVRDCRENGWLPSVTTILACLARPALEEWKMRQAVHAVVTAPDVPGETLDDKIVRVLDTEGQHDEESRIARDRGTAMHDALECYFTGKPVLASLAPWILPAAKAIAAYGTLECCERVLVGDGYAGKCDLVIEGQDFTFYIFDWKTCKNLPDKPWPEAVAQGAFYAAAYWKLMKGEPAIADPRQIVTGNVYISTRDQGSYAIFTHDHWEPAYKNACLPLLSVYKHWNKL